MLLTPKPRKWKKKIPGIEKNKIKVWMPYIREIQEQEKKEIDKEFHEETIEDTKETEQEKIESQIYEKNINEAEEKLNQLKSEKHKLFLLLKNMIEEEEEKKKIELIKQKQKEEKEREERMEQEIKQELEKKYGTYSQDTTERYRIQQPQTYGYMQQQNYRPPPPNYYNRRVESPKKRERDPSPPTPYYHGQNYRSFYDRDPPQTNRFDSYPKNPNQAPQQPQGYNQNQMLYQRNNYSRDRYNNYYNNK